MGKGHKFIVHVFVCVFMPHQFRTTKEAQCTIPLITCATHGRGALHNSQLFIHVVNGAEWLGGNSQQVTGDSGLI